MRTLELCLVALVMLGGCTVAPRRAAPPTVLNGAAPDGFPRTVRLVTTDLAAYASGAPRFFAGIRKAAAGGDVDILALSGGGSEGAYGAGALIGLTRAHHRPHFELVTGVSAGALIAPFAYLGPRWDPELEAAFTADRSRLIGRSPFWRLLTHLLFPLGRNRHNPLFEMVDRYVTPQLLAAVARRAATGRQLVVATTDLDTEETVLWSMGAIAQRGGEAGRELFRDVLVASASVPGVFPPILIHVQEGGKKYDELHVDGSVTTSVFTFPLVAAFSPQDLPPLHGGRLYMIVNSQLARLPSATPINTFAVLARSFSAGMTYKTRESIIDTINLTNRLGMHFRLTEIPADFPGASVVNFDPRFMRKLFAYGERCAKQGLLWITPQQSIKRNNSASPAAATPTACPGATAEMVP